MRFIMLGAPGSGKGTQAEKLSKFLDIPHLSTGKLLREHVDNKTEIGLNIAAYMSNSQFVPDSAINALVEAYVLHPTIVEGFILDGYPRTRQQAIHLNNLMDVMRKPITAAIYIRVDQSILLDRILARAKADAEIGKARTDDTPEAFEGRILDYNQQTAPLIDSYTRMGNLIEIDGNKAVDDVFADIAQRVSHVS